MYANLASATTGSGGFPVTQLITLLVVLAVLYPVQKRLRAAASRQRRERWAREGLLDEPEDAASPTDHERWQPPHASEAPDDTSEPDERPGRS